MGDLTERVAERHLTASDPDVLYHGTAMNRVWGLRRDAESEIYLAEDIETTRMYAGIAAAGEAHRGDDYAPVSLELDVRTLKREGWMGPDWDDVVRDIHRFEADSVADVTWRESLEVLGTCFYEGPVGPAIVGIIEFTEDHL